MSLEHRRLRGDLIAIFRLIVGNDKYDREDLVVCDKRTKRGHKKKLKGTCRKDMMKLSFPHGTVEAWNALDKKKVIEATIQNFEM